MLERGLELLGSRPVVYRLNPKAMPRQQLLGSLNLDTREWSDGVLTAAARKVSGWLSCLNGNCHDSCLDFGNSSGAQLATFSYSNLQTLHMFGVYACMLFRRCLNHVIPFWLVQGTTCDKWCLL